MFPRLIIDLARIRANTERMMELCGNHGVEVMGVTKGVCGDLEIARALVDAGVTKLGDSRLENLSKLRAGELGVPLWLLRAPSRRDAAACVAAADGSLQSDLGTLHAVADEAQRRNEPHHVVLMVDLDTGREGFHPDEVLAACEAVAALEGVELDGLGIYFDFKSTKADIRRTLENVTVLARTSGVSIRVLSGGASNVLELVVDGTLPPEVNQLRLGTAPLLGLFTSHGPRPIDGWERDTITVEAEVIEAKRNRSEAVLALGHVDAPMDYLYPVTPGIELLRQSSDHTIVRSNAPLEVSSTVSFRLGYNALNRLVTSGYSNIVYR